MKTLKALLMATVMVFAVAACGDGVAVDDSTASSVLDDAGDTASSLAEEGSDQAALVAAQVETELDQLETAVANSDASAELQADFDALRTEITAALDSLTEDGMVEAPDLTDELESFQTSLDDLGEDVGDDLRSSWDTLRATLESIIS